MDSTKIKSLQAPKKCSQKMQLLKTPINYIWKLIKFVAFLSRPTFTYHTQHHLKIILKLKTCSVFLQNLKTLKTKGTISFKIKQIKIKGADRPIVSKGQQGQKFHLHSCKRQKCSFQDQVWRWCWFGSWLRFDNLECWSNQI